MASEPLPAQDLTADTRASKSAKVSVQTEHSKRSRYSTHACNECKRRKVKCNGLQPCQRCVRQEAECSYQRHMLRGGDPNARASDDIQEQIRQMQAVLNSLTKQLQSQGSLQQTQTPAVDLSWPNYGTSARTGSCDASQTYSPYAPVRGPTSTEFTLNVVKDGFRAMGYDPTTPSENLSGHSGNQINPNVSSQDHYISPILRLILDDPLWKLGEDRSSRLIGKFINGPGAMYPVLMPDVLYGQCRMLFTALGHLQAPGVASQKENDAASGFLLRTDATIMRLVLAIGIALEKEDPDRLMNQLYTRAREDLTRVLLDGATTLQQIVCLILAALFHFHLDQEHNAGRFVSMSARACYELGLHRKDSLLRAFPGSRLRDEAVIVFWSTYTLDRRESSSRGIPFVMQDIDIDITLPMPVTCISQTHNAEQGQSAVNLHPVSPDQQTTHLGSVDAGSLRVRTSIRYLDAMVDFARLSGKAYRLVNNLADKSLPIPQEEMGYVDYQLRQFHSKLPEELQIACQDITDDVSGAQDDVCFYLRVVLRTRMYQLSNLLWRPALYSKTRAASHPGHAKQAIEAARETIVFFHTVNAHSDLLQSHPVFFKHFLVNALGVLLLGVVYAWEKLGRHSGREFYQALDLLKVVCAESTHIARIWEPLHALEKLASKHGLKRAVPLAAAAETTSLPVIVASPTQDAQPVPILATSDMDVDMEYLNSMEFKNDFAILFDSGFGGINDLNDFPLNELFPSSPTQPYS